MCVQYVQKQPPGCSLKKVFLKILQISRKTPVLESLFNKVAGLRHTYVEEHLRATASICNKIFEKIRSVFHI